MYGGTKSELERLVADAEKLTGQALDPAKFSDVITAIHAVQDNLGITGTTAKEAATTIEGSIGMMKAAWDNLLVGIANENGDLGSLIYEFAHTVEIAASNILPRVKIILGGISQLIADMGPMIASGITSAVQNAPVFLNAAISLLQSLGSSILAQTDTLLQSAMDLVMFLANAIIENVDGLAESAVTLVQSIANFVSENSGMLADKAVDLLLSLANTIVENAPKLSVAAIQIVGSLATGIIDNIPRLVEGIPTLISKFVEGFASVMSEIVDVGKNIVEGIWQGIQNMASWIKNKVKNFFGGIVDSVKGLLGIHSPSTVFADMGRNMALGMGEGWDSEFSKVKGQIEDGMNFQTGSVDFTSSALGRSQTGLTGAINSVAATMGQNFTITVQSVLDGRVIGETAYQYSRNKARAYGG